MAGNRAQMRKDIRRLRGPDGATAGGARHHRNAGLRDFPEGQSQSARMRNRWRQVPIGQPP
jgi:hypothetical protein